MGKGIAEYIDDQIENYCKYHWEEAQKANDTPFNIKEFRNCFIMQLIKNAYYVTEPKESLRALRGNDQDAARMQDSRNLAYAQHYRKLWYDEIQRNLGLTEEELLPDDIESMKDRLEGHKITAMQYFELETMQKYPLLKSIVNKRICDVKKISVETFKDYMNGYDSLVHELLKGLDGDAESVVFSAIALYTLEWKYNVELFYTCAVNAEKYGRKEMEPEKIGALCCEIPTPILDDPFYPKMLHIQSRFILNRIKVVPAIYDGSQWEPYVDKIYHYLCMNYYFDRIIVHHDSLVDYYAGISTREQWAEFIKENYNLKELFKPKEWTNKRIRYVRDLYDFFIKEQPTPKS